MAVLQQFSMLAVLVTVMLHDTANAAFPPSGATLTRLGDGFYHFVRSAKNWHEAARYCRSLGLELASLETAQEHDLVTAEMKRLGMGPGYKAWIGANDLGVEGKFYWSGTGAAVPPKSGSYPAWVDGEPNNAGGNEHCVALRNDNSVFQWNDDNCGSGFDSVCELLTTCWGDKY